jgi:type IV secretory pathway TraG/TraD family ATPase VirD4
MSLASQANTPKNEGMSSQKAKRITYLGRANFHDKRRIFGIQPADRLAHTYVIGKTGSGKSTLLETLVRQDIEAGNGLAILDPHGDLIERLVAAVPEKRKKDIIYFNVPDSSRPLTFNPLETSVPFNKPLAVSGLLEVFKKIWSDSWGPRLEHVLRNALLALMDQPTPTLADVLRILDDKTFRNRVAEETSNEQVRAYWLREYEGYSYKFRAVIIAPIQNKVGAFLTDPILNGILNQTKSAFNVREVMDQGKILLVNLAKGKIGEDSAALLGALLVTKIGLAGLSRADTPEEDRRDFFIYMDEFHTFTTLSVATMLSELRKYRVGMILAHQYLSQLDPQVRDAVLGNTGTIITFRLGAEDAQTLAKEFEPEFSALDLTTLPNYHIYLKLMVEGEVTRPFSARTLRPS